jgi:hypothetical protein
MIGELMVQEPWWAAQPRVMHDLFDSFAAAALFAIGDMPTPEQLICWLIHARPGIGDTIIVDRNSA